MANTLKLEIVTPEAKVYSEDVEMVTLPGIEGELGIYPMHVPLMTQITHGEIVARQGGQDHYLAVGEGFVQVTGDRVAILTDMAIKADDIWLEAAGTRAPAGATNGPRPLSDMEKDAIIAALDATGGNRRRAAELLGIAERTLYDKLKRYDIDQ